MSGAICRCSSMVEPQPSKLMTWVRFPLPAPLSKIVAPDESIEKSAKCQ